MKFYRKQIAVREVSEGQDHVLDAFPFEGKVAKPQVLTNEVYDALRPL